MADAGTVQSLIAPRRYIQGRGVLASIGRHVAELGQQPLLIADENVWKLTGDQLSASFKEAGVDFTRETFGGVCSHREIDRITEAARTAKADVVVGIGGGTTLDTAKAAGHQAGIAWATVPTVASTDAPTSALSVVYTDDGVFEEYVFFPHNPDLVLVDTQLCANAPYRFLVSGMGDALATWVEARATAEARKSTMAGGQPTMAGLALAGSPGTPCSTTASRPGRPPSSTSSRPPWRRWWRPTPCCPGSASRAAAWPPPTPSTTA
jgi:glycerol dehydrogenase